MEGGRRKSALAGVGLAVALGAVGSAWIARRFLDRRQDVLPSSVRSWEAQASPPPSVPSIEWPLPRPGVGAGWVFQKCKGSREPIYRLRGEIVHVDGGSEAAIVQRVVRQNYGRVRDCAKQAFPHPIEGPLGEWTMTFEITPGGRIAGVRTDPAASLEFAKCLRAAFTRATIGFPRAEERTVVEYRWRLAWGTPAPPAQPCEDD